MDDNESPSLSESDPPSFDGAVARLRRFAESQGASADLFWVFREYVTTFRDAECIRVPVPAENAELARAYYEFGRDQALGVTLGVLCQLGGRSACYVWVPSDESEAEYRLQGRGLKLCVHKGRGGTNRSGVPVQSYLAWKYRCWRSRRWAHWNGLSSRREARERMRAAIIA
jgi:hypothetical protein